MSKKYTVVVDWDDTIVTNVFPKEATDFRPGAIEALHTLSQHFRVMVFTCRLTPATFGGITKTRAALAQEAGAIRSLLDSVGLTQVEIYQGEGKPFGIAYVDDRGIHYNGRPKAWEHITDKLLAMIGVDNHELVESSDDRGNG